MHCIWFDVLGLLYFEYKDIPSAADVEIDEVDWVNILSLIKDLVEVEICSLATVVKTSLVCTNGDTVDVLSLPIILIVLWLSILVLTCKALVVDNLSTVSVDTSVVGSILDVDTSAMCSARGMFMGKDSPPTIAKKW